MDSEYIELKQLFDILNLKLDFDLTPEQTAKIAQDFPEAERENEKLKKKKEIYKQRVDRAEILLSFLTLKYNFNYGIFVNLMKNYNNLLPIDLMEERITELDLNNLNYIEAKELEDYYYNYIYHYYKIILEKIQDFRLRTLILRRVKQLKNLVYRGFSLMEDLTLKFRYELVDREEYNKELSDSYENALRRNFFTNNKKDKKYETYNISLPEKLDIFRNKRVNNGIYQGNYAYIPTNNPMNSYRIEKEIEAGQVYQYKGQNILSTIKRKIYPIERLSKFTTIPREVLMSYNYKILGIRMDRINLIKRLEEINSSHEFIKKLLFTIFVDYILLFISDLNNLLKERNIGLLVSGGFAYRYYNQSYITEDIDIILGDLIDGKINIKPIENYQEIFGIIVEYFNNIKAEDFTNIIILNIIKKFFKDLKRLGININTYDNIKQFYTQLENNNIEVDFNLSSPPLNDKILKLTIVLNNFNRFAYVDININDKAKAINTFSIINKINPFEIQENYLRNELNIDLFYLYYQREIENTFYPVITSINPIYDTASILNIIDINYILYEKSYLIDKLNNNLLFGIIPLELSEPRLSIEKERLLEKFNKLLRTHYEYNNFYSFNPSPQQIQLFNTFIG